MIPTRENGTKGIVIILDGLGDRPIPGLDRRTPLEAARTPALDLLVQRGMCGMSDPLIPGLPVGTHTGAAVLLGIPPGAAARLNRGPVEAAGINIPLLPGDITLRANFATLASEGGKLAILDRRAGRIARDTDALADALRDIDLGDDITGNLYAATQHRAVLHLRGAALSAGITDTDPGDGNIHLGVLEALPNESSEGALVTAAALNRFIEIAHRRLSAHPVNRHRQAQGSPPGNGIITRGAGLLEPLSSSISHNRLRAALISGESTVLGLGRLLGYSVITSPAFTALEDTDIRGKLTAAIKALESHDIVFIHLKAPDIASHDRAPLKKKAFIERFDQELGRLDLAPHTVLVSGDHSTDSIAGSHSGDPVPSILYSPGGRSDGCRRFGEIDCMNGGLGRLSASALLCSALDAMGAIGQYRTSDAELFGL